MNPVLPVQTLEVASHRVRRDGENPRNLLVRLPFSNQVEYVDLPRRKTDRLFSNHVATPHA